MLYIRDAIVWVTLIIQHKNIKLCLYYPFISLQQVNIQVVFYIVFDNSDFVDNTDILH